tara:strand:- start:485 stop:712 length:228 start_codon:yes stop_codon:yes gene_type:complete
MRDFGEVKFISPLFLLQIYSFKLTLKKDQKIIRSKIAREKRSSPYHLIIFFVIFLEDDEDTHAALHDARQGRTRR